MNQKNKVTVRILDKDYTMVSDDSKEYMKRVARFVDDIMTETYESNQKLGTSMIGVLAALKIADELHKVKEEKEELEKRLNSPTYELKNTRDELNALANEFERRHQAYEKMVSDISGLIDKASLYETDVKQLRQRIEQLDHDLKQKEEKL
ncbi:cell division protein ZapA [Fusibacter sp. JL298sf-3]